MQEDKKDEFIYGFRAIIEAIEANKEIDKVLIKKGLSNDLFKEMFNIVRAHKIPFQYVPNEKLNQITRKNHQGVVAFICPVEYQKIEDILPMIYEDGREPFILILDGITDVRNFGSIARTAECAGVDAIIMPVKKAARINADSMKTSAGALSKIPVCRVNRLAESIQFLKESGIEVIAATEKTDVLYTETDVKGPCALIMGSEDKGIAREHLALADKQMKIPLKGSIQSLNVSVATGILLYEIIRQKGGSYLTTDFLPD